MSAEKWRLRGDRPSRYRNVQDIVLHSEQTNERRQRPRPVELGQRRSGRGRRRKPQPVPEEEGQTGAEPARAVPAPAGTKRARGRRRGRVGASSPLRISGEVQEQREFEPRRLRLPVPVLERTRRSVRFASDLGEISAEAANFV